MNMRCSGLILLERLTWNDIRNVHDGVFYVDFFLLAVGCFLKNAITDVWQGPKCTSLFNVNNKNTKATSSDIFLVFLFLILVQFNIYCFYVDFEDDIACPGNKPAEHIQVWSYASVASRKRINFYVTGRTLLEK